MNIEPEGIQVRNPEQGRGGRGSEFRGLKRKRKAQFPAHLQAHLGRVGVELESEGEGDESSCDLVKTLGTMWMLLLYFAVHGTSGGGCYH
ncbi:hypothetical protein Bca52824_063004 [Brassica carinata]|uniref:Uncharacterized protein n=1 Tax=Brassica carinata TaxID=52824 RepID=A0A8X7QJ00_BRACI|nr:hypothetical protein Bca52824_063004 [Brassica carinata]